jgi:hypothetical protein
MNRICLPAAGEKARDIGLWCEKRAVRMVRSEDEGYWWFIGPSMRLSWLLENFWPRAAAMGLLSAVEPVPAGWDPFHPALEQTLPGVADHVATVKRVTDVMEAFLLADRVHEVADSQGSPVCPLQLQCLGRDGPWAASFDVGTIGCDEPWFEDGHIQRYPLAAQAWTMEWAIKDAALAALRYMEEEQRNEKMVVGTVLADVAPECPWRNVVPSGRGESDSPTDVGEEEVTE